MPFFMDGGMVFDRKQIVADLNDFRVATTINWKTLAALAGQPPALVSRVVNGRSLSIDAFLSLCKVIAKNPMLYHKEGDD